MAASGEGYLEDADSTRMRTEDSTHALILRMNLPLVNQHSCRADLEAEARFRHRTQWVP